MSIFIQVTDQNTYYVWQTSIEIPLVEWLSTRPNYRAFEITKERYIKCLEEQRKGRAERDKRRNEKYDDWINWDEQ